MAQPEPKLTRATPIVCVVSFLDHAPSPSVKVASNPDLMRIVVDRTAKSKIRLTLHGAGDGKQEQVPAEHGADAIVKLLSATGADFVVVSCNGDVNLDARAIAEAATIASRGDGWATQFDLALGSRGGFGYSYADFVQYRMIDLKPPLAHKAPSILGNLLIRKEIFLEHAADITLLPSATVWHRLMALRLVSLYGLPTELPIIAGWRRQQFGLGRVDSVRHNVANLSAFLDRAMAEAAGKPEQSGSLLLLMALQDRICRLLFPTDGAASTPSLPASARQAIDRTIEASLTDRTHRLCFAADIVDQMSLNSLKGLEYAPEEVERRIGASLLYALEMDAFTGLAINAEKLGQMARLLLAGSTSDTDFKSSIAPNIPLLVSALSQSKSNAMRDMLIDNLSRLGESMDATTLHGLPELRVAKKPVETRAFAMAMLIRTLNALNLVPLAIQVRDRLRRLKLVS